MKRESCCFVIAFFFLTTLLLYTTILAQPKKILKILENKWRTVEIGEVKYNFKDIEVEFEYLWIALADNGKYIYSEDQGSTWKVNETLSGTPTNSISRQQSESGNSSNWTIVGDGGAILSTTNNGQTWETKNSGTTSNLNEVFYTWCPGTLQSWAFAVGDGATIRVSKDGGSTWESQTTEFIYDDFYSTYFFNNVYGWIVGSTGIMYATYNSGDNWNYVSVSSSNPNLYGVYFSSPDEGVAVGADGFLSLTTDAGLHWVEKNSGTANHLFFVNSAAADSDNGSGEVLAIGEKGTLLADENNDGQWEAYNLGTTEDLKKFDVDSEGYLWIVGNNGTLITNKPEINKNFFASTTSINLKSAKGNDKTIGDNFFLNAYNQDTHANVSWTAMVKEPEFIHLFPTSGEGSSKLYVFLDPTALPAGEQETRIVIHSEEGDTVKVGVEYEKTDLEDVSNPIGEIKSPSEGSTLNGSVPVIGWALDDVAVDAVSVWLTSPEGQKLLGEAPFVKGLFPNIATDEQYENYPYKEKAGWQYNLITNLLPNGQQAISVVASDGYGNSTELGSRTITVDNEHAVKPFGAIDTPTPGESVRGDSYRNWGWVLTPLPNKIPIDGSTINVLIDGVNVGHPTYNNYRDDIASLFPGYNNNNGAVGYYDIDVKNLSQGIHTIQWTATDNAGNSDGIGSRYFTISNTSAEPVGAGSKSLKFGSPAGGLHKSSNGTELNSSLVHNAYKQYISVKDYKGTTNWKVSTNKSWISLSPLTGSGAGTVEVMVNPTSLSNGLNKGWVMLRDAEDKSLPNYIDVEFEIIGSSKAPFGEFNYPDKDRKVSGQVKLMGWALDDVGISSVKIYRKASPQNILVGDAVIGVETMPIISSLYSKYPFSSKAGWSCNLESTTLTDGEYNFVAELTDYEGKVTSVESAKFIIDNSAVAVEKKQLPVETFLHPVYPNPFNPGTTIYFQLNKNDKVSLVIYDLLGREVSTILNNENRTAGNHKLYWDGRNNHGMVLPSGVYFLLMKSGNYIQTQKLVLLK